MVWWFAFAIFVTQAISRTGLEFVGLPVAGSPSSMHTGEVFHTTAEHLNAAAKKPEVATRVDQRNGRPAPRVDNLFHAASALSSLHIGKSHSLCQTKHH
jgi:hypothetical protein